MVALGITTLSIGIYEPLTFVIIAVLNVVCSVYLVRRYLEKREKITWLFIAFFAILSVFFFVNFLIGVDILYFDLREMLLYTYLIGATIVAVIGLVMLGVKQIYALPPLVTILAFFHQSVLDSNLTVMMNFIQAFSYYSTGQFIGATWFITLKAMFPNLVVQGLQASTVLNLLFDPLAIFQRTIIGIYLAVIVVPTTVLFFILAWKNRSGRSLGFALGLATNIIVGFMSAATTAVVSRGFVNVLTLTAAIFFVLGIVGVFDKLMKK